METQQLTAYGKSAVTTTNKKQHLENIVLHPKKH